MTRPEPRLRIAQVAPVAGPVRPGSGDSIEQLVGLLSDGLVRRGHDVTLYATGDSQTTARLRSVRDRGYEDDPELWDWQFCETLHAAAAFARAGDHDVVHAHNLHFSVPFMRFADVPVVETQHVESSPEVLDAERRMPGVHLVAISEHQRTLLGSELDVSVIPNAIDVESFAFSATPGGSLLFLGRLIADKGPLDAIRVARAAGMAIVLAGPLDDAPCPELEAALQEEGARYVGPVDHATRDRLLADAAALVFPIKYAEPFGLVMIEAMACGTPVLATRLGAVEDVVEDGLTGFTAPTWEGLAAHVPAAVALDRAAIRARAQERFDVARMVDDYEALYHRLVAGPR